MQGAGCREVATGKCRVIFREVDYICLVGNATVELLVSSNGTTYQVINFHTLSESIGLRDACRHAMT